MDTNQITYYIGLLLGGIIIIALLALPIVLIIVAIRNYRALKTEVNSYHKIVEAEDLEAARKRALDDAEEAKLQEEMKKNSPMGDNNEQ